MAEAAEVGGFWDRALGGRLWRHGDFMRLWVGQTVSEAGTQVSQLAVPTVAILLLRATPFQVGLLTALEFLPFPVLGLVAGVYADRLKRRPLMIVSDIGRMLALLTVPVAFSLGLLRMEQLYFVALIVGVFNVFFGISYQSYLPALIDRSDLVEGNSKIEVSRSTAQLAGPAIAGFAIQAIGAARAIYIDAASFLVSAVSLWLIRKPEPEPSPGSATGQTGFWHEMWEGIQVVFGNPTLWKIAGCTATSNLGSNIAFAVELIFMYRYLHLAPAVVGVVFAVGAVGALLGAIATGPIVARLGVGLSLLLSILSGGLLMATVLAGYTNAPLFLSALFFVEFLLGAPYNITQVSLRQAITPDRVQGRMNATMRTIVWGTIPIGSLLGGILATAIGVVPTIVLGGFISLLAAGWILAGPIRIRVQPEPVG
ncbi:MAG: MFS transporter [Candidatus Dormibacteraeota bacterium]|nr:MFS transporter [Candidatus Dormibacteraeota bacterium]